MEGRGIGSGICICIIMAISESTVHLLNPILKHVLSAQMHCARIFGSWSADPSPPA
jgi:preprotein translocase subunit SecY